MNFNELEFDLTEIGYSRRSQYLFRYEDAVVRRGRPNVCVNHLLGGEFLENPSLVSRQS